MSGMKTVETDADPRAFLATVQNAGRRQDATAVMEMMARITSLPPRMWGASIIGFGSYSYSRRDGSRHRFFRTGLSPRKQNLAVYIMPGLKRYPDILTRLGPHKHSVSCLYLGRLTRIDAAALEDLVRASLDDMARMFPD